MNKLLSCFKHIPQSHCKGRYICFGEFFGKGFEGGIRVRGRKDAGLYSDCFFIEIRNTSRRCFGSVAALYDGTQWYLVLIIGIHKIEAFSSSTGIEICFMRWTSSVRYEDFIKSDFSIDSIFCQIWPSQQPVETSRNKDEQLFIIPCHNSLDGTTMYMAQLTNAQLH